MKRSIRSWPPLLILAAAAGVLSLLLNIEYPADRLFSWHLVLPSVVRRRLREVSIEAQIESGEIETFDELYTSEGRRVSPPMDWGDPQDALASQQFIVMLQACVDDLPASLGRVFLLREWLEYDTAEICKQLGITATNCHVMLYRARMRLRECVENHWFARRAAA